MIKVLPASHTDHRMTEAQIDAAFRAAIEHVAASPSDDIEGATLTARVFAIELSPSLGEVPCALWGPCMGDAPISDSEVTLEVRNGRAGPSRMVRRGLRGSRLVTVIVGPYEDEPCVLYTMHGGPPAPREPWDRSLTDEGRAESIAFWAEHALAFEDA